jgi:hypothetical protein
MMKSLFRGVFVVLLLAESISLAQERLDSGGSLQVVAEGAGKTRDDAIKDALRNAVRQAIGTFVDAESQVVNDRVIKDSVLLYSDGFVERFDVVPGTGTMQDGIFRVSISAEVKKNALSDSLKEANLKTSKVDGAGLFAEATTKHEAEKNAVAMFARIFSEFPTKLLTAKASGNPRIVS